MKQIQNDILVRLVVLCWVATPNSASATETTEAQAARMPVFAFCFDTHDAEKRDLLQQAEMLQRIGFDGVGHVGLELMQQRLASLDRMSLKLFLAGVRIELTKGSEEQLRLLRQVMPMWKDRNVVLYVVLAGLPTEETSGETAAIAVLREIAKITQGSDVRVGIYPHTNDWVARFDHAIRIAKKVDRPNVGVIFNLCHWLRNEELSTLEPLLRKAGPLLQAVTINGADLAGKSDENWKRLILPLDQGNFDIRGLLQSLQEVGYAGPMGIMCYGIGGDAQGHLTRSLAAWRQLANCQY